MTAKEFNTQLTNLQSNLQYFANSLTGNREDANDLLQDTYLKALNNRDKYQDDTNLKAWTYTIMRNTFINNYRKMRNINSIIDTHDDLSNLNLQRISDFPSPESVLMAKEINNEIAHLNEIQRSTFELYNEGFKYHEIADNLNISIGTVKSRIYLTRQKLMDTLEDYKN
jgi:RNA polymerase sigma-70 factor, ECF subfamily